MILYPAIDLKDGHCVRLLRGEMAAATVFGEDPAAQAAAFVAAGCSWLHLVDLNGAFAGMPVNGAAVEAILARVAVPCQLGGGIRDMATIAAWLDRGKPVDREEGTSGTALSATGEAEEEAAHALRSTHAEPLPPAASTLTSFEELHTMYLRNVVPKHGACGGRPAVAA